MRYDRTRHTARASDDYVFAQLIPYLGSKRKLLGLIGESLAATAVAQGTFADLFAGSGVVSRFARTLGLATIANDWEPYALAINRCWIECDAPPPFAALGGYPAAIDALNDLPPIEGWVARHLCPADDDHLDPARDRLFFTRANGTRIDAIRERIDAWQRDGTIDAREASCLIAPLLYSACYVANTSGVFKGFHAGWGGKTATALHRIKSRLRLRPAIFQTGAAGRATNLDATACARAIGPVDVAYLDPPYNQHPYATNYHVLNSIALWDQPALPPTITPGTKAAIRDDWQRDRRSPYNHRGTAERAYRDLLDAVDARFLLTSYSTDGTIPLESLLSACVARGATSIRCATYKRYRVSTQRFSTKPVNVEFVATIDAGRRHDGDDVEALATSIRAHERAAIAGHRETIDNVAE